MSINRDDDIIDKFTELQKACSMKVTILNDQVMEIVVADLMAKYKACKQRNDEDSETFRKVLAFYLTEDEMIEMESLTND